MKKFLILVCLLASAVSCTEKEDFVDDAIDFCLRQTDRSLEQLHPYNFSMSPRNVAPGDTIWHQCPVSQELWTEGFWPGVLWYAAEYTMDKKYRDAARGYTEVLEFLSRQKPYDHDLGFIMLCSYGNGYRVTGDPRYRMALIKSAERLLELYNPKVGTILSWPRETEYFGGHNTIMDNMINLELLFWAADNAAKPIFREVAIAHADTTMKYHFREDGSCYHVAVYDSEEGDFIRGCTHQGYSDDSMWARGQAWAIYGYTMVYRFTKEPRFLEHARKVTDIYLKNLPQDKIPYWDFNDPGIPDAPRDASAAAVVASALLELCEYVDAETAEYYYSSAVEMLRNLDSSYRPTDGNPSFLLHSTGHHPAGSEIDYSIIYADYYYLEALLRLKNRKKDPVTYKAFYPGAIWKDNNGKHINAHGGGILLHKGIYYWFGEHKTEGRAGNKAHVGVHCYSSRDLYNWKDEGIALKVSKDDSSDIADGCILERPKVIYNAKTHKFVMWFHLEPKGAGYEGARVGIAQADKVTGPYTFIRSTRCEVANWPVNVQPFHKEPVKERYLMDRANLAFGEHPDSVNTLGRDFAKGQHSRDQTLFVDDDGKAYHIRSSESNSVIQISLLTDDYLDFSGKYIRAFIGTRLEAPAIFKKDGLYYIMGSECTGWRPNPAHSGVAESIWGPWKETGNPCVDKDSETTYFSQSTWIIPVAGKKDAYIYMGDRWRPENAIDGRYIWLPLEFEDGRFILRWRDEWDLSIFND